MAFYSTKFPNIVVGNLKNLHTMLLGPIQQFIVKHLIDFQKHNLIFLFSILLYSIKIKILISKSTKGKILIN
jgi:hypothetical protein